MKLKNKTLEGKKCKVCRKPILKDYHCECYGQFFCSMACFDKYDSREKNNG
jgi:hypothetical protein